MKIEFDEEEEAILVQSLIVTRAQAKSFGIEADVLAVQKLIDKIMWSEDE